MCALDSWAPAYGRAYSPGAYAEAYPRTFEANDYRAEYAYEHMAQEEEERDRNRYVHGQVQRVLSSNENGDPNDAVFIFIYFIGFNCLLDIIEFLGFLYLNLF